jgi:hypothetical protein
VKPSPIVERLDKDNFGEDKSQEKQDWDDSITYRTQKNHGEDSSRRTLTETSP